MSEEKKRTTPRRKNIIPRVAMNDGITSLVVIRPFANPTTTPTSRASETASQSGQPQSLSDTPMR